MKRDISVNVKNQFHFNPHSKTACVPISIQALFHMYEAFVERNELLDDEQWHMIMANGSILWQRWKKKPENSKREIPTLFEILEMPDCRTFNLKFGTNPIDYGGLVTKKADSDAAGDSLSTLLKNLTEQTKPACALLIIPVNICVSLVCRRERSAPHGYSLFMFDSHGKKNDIAKRCELVQFFDYSHVVTHLIEKYDIRSLECLPQRTRANYSEEEIATDFGYHALLFVQ